MFSNKDLSRLILPLIVEQFLAVTIGMADTVMVSSVGEAAMSGVSIVDTINILLINIFAALATGGAIVTSQYLGRGERKNANTAARQLVFSTAFLSLVIMTLCLVFRRQMLYGIFGHAEQDVMANALVYFLVTALSYPFIAVYNAGAALFRSMGNSRVSMLTSIVMNAVNIIGNAVCIYGLKMGVLGAALPTLLSRITGAVLIMFLLRDNRHPIFITQLTHIRPDWSMIKRILGIGIPNGLENGMFQIGKIMVQSLVTSFGTVAVAANAVANSVGGIPQIPAVAIGLAMVTVVGQCVGAGDYDAARRYIIRLSKYSYLSMFLTNLPFVLALTPIIGCFNLHPETAEVARQVLLSNSACMIFIWVPSFTLPNGLRAANDVKYTMTMSVLSMWIFRVGFSYILGQYLGLGLLGAWCGMYIDWFARAVAFILRFFSGKWKSKQLLPDTAGTAAGK